MNAFAVIEHTDAAAWDALVSRHAQGHVLQSWAWGELKRRYGWRPLRLAITDGQRTAAAHLLLRPSYGLAVAYVPRGPLWSGDAQLDRALVRLLRRVARRQRAAFLRLEPNLLEDAPAAPELHALLLSEGFQPAEPLQPRTSIHLDLRPAPEALLAGASKGHRADVRRAERNGVQVRVGSDEADLERFYAIMQATAARQQFAIHSRAYYQAAWQLLGDAARLLLAEQDGATLAAFLVFAWGREAQYMYSGATEAGLKVGANHLLQWHALCWARARGAQVYDFWGIPDAFGRMRHATPEERERLEAVARQHPLYGVYRFKKGWGGQVVRYLPAYDQVYLAPAYWFWQRRRQGAE